MTNSNSNSKPRKQLLQHRLIINWKGFPEWKTQAYYSSVDEFLVYTPTLQTAISAGELTITESHAAGDTRLVILPS